MSESLVPAAAETETTVARGGGELVLPRLIVEAGPSAVARFLEFFAARIANARTRAAYGRAVGQFLAWCEARGLGLGSVSPLHVAAYIRTHPGSAPTVKQHLAAIRMLCDWLVVSQVLPVNPAAAVRGPKHVVTKGATPVLTPAEARKLLEHIDTGTLAGLRDRGLFSVMLYSSARVSAVLGMRRQDYFQQGSRGWLRLHEKGGKRHDVPAHHRAAERPRRLPRGRGGRGRAGGVVSERGPGGRSADGAVVDAAGGAGHDQAAGGDRGAPALDVLPHVPGDGDHGVPVERGHPRARAADRGARVAENDEALRPDRRHRHRRRDRTHRDLTLTGCPGGFKACLVPDTRTFAVPAFCVSAPDLRLLKWLGIMERWPVTRRCTALKIQHATGAPADEPRGVSWFLNWILGALVDVLGKRLATLLLGTAAETMVVVIVFASVVETTYIPPSEVDPSGAPPGGPITWVAPEYQRLEEENRGLQQATTTLREENRGLQQATTTLREENRGLQQATTTLREENRGLQQATTTLREENRGLQQATTTLREENAALRLELDRDLSLPEFETIAELVTGLVVSQSPPIGSERIGQEVILEVEDIFGDPVVVNWSVENCNARILTYIEQPVIRFIVSEPIACAIFFTVGATSYGPFPVYIDM